MAHVALFIENFSIDFNKLDEMVRVYVNAP